MNARTKRSAASALGLGMLGGLQWRLMLLWVFITLLPTLVVALPLWRVLDGLLGHSVHAEEWARHFNGLFLGDVSSALQASPWIGSAFVAGAVLTLAISPFLSGMAVAGGRANRALSFGGLLQGGATEYGRMLRLLPLSLIPYGLVVLAAKGVSSLVDDKVDAALLPSTADMYQHGSLVVIALCFVVAQAIVESARAQFIADITLRSAWRAFGRGVVQVVRRPVASLFAYVVITAVGLGLTVLIASWRGHSVAVGGEWFAAFLIVQLGVAVVAWMRTARLLALAGLASSTQQRRRRSDFAPAM
ncbi:hypothetical protein [Dyella sp. 333MFSha]|uniref:hypothetical protein n=1 Tax=Dyella sp. 333MFSha TaxID=1798240 RepID=UPI0008913A1E|nr:hypothetical protein [Dyella sp. 333MFSha]SDF22491.1 hypothetical protein SAMN04515659_0432 [Dyella sp. 333MFSha]